jgi:anti-sigma B factor antagonist
MSLRINTRIVNDVTILELSGKITIGEGSVTLRNEIAKLVGSNNKKVLLNLGDVRYVDSSGIGELVSSFTTISNAGGQLKLLNLTQKIEDLLAITKLLTVFDTFTSEEEALASFN